MSRKKGISPLVACGKNQHFPHLQLGQNLRKSLHVIMSGVRFARAYLLDSTSPRWHAAPLSDGLRGDDKTLSLN